MPPEDADEAERLVVRTAEWERQVTRSLYALSQQTKDVETDINQSEQLPVEQRLAKRVSYVYRKNENKLQLCLCRMKIFSYR